MSVKKETVIFLIIFAIVAGMVAYFSYNYGRDVAELPGRIASDVTEIVTEITKEEAVPKKVYPRTDGQFKKQSMTIDQAYGFMNVERVQFSLSDAKIPTAEAAYLDKLFKMTNIIVVERIQNQTELQQTGKVSDLSNYDEVLEYLINNRPPEVKELQFVHVFIIDAITDQREYFEWLSANGEYFTANDKRVQDSHQNLLKAYGVLLAKYKNDTNSHRAFYSHLCALDFI